MYKKCEFCGEDMKIRTIAKGKRKGDVLKKDKNKRFCSISCLNNWQKEVKWEDRIGEDVAEKIRQETSKRVSGDKNPSCNKDVAEKISKSLSLYLETNPRIGEKNPFFGKTHKDETKEYLSKSKKGKCSYDDDGYKKLCENTPKGENHPNWKDGSSITPYENFTRKKKKEIKLLDNNTCCVCGKETQKLVVHHIDYNKSNGDINNLISLCTSCHGKTNFNRENWKLFFEKHIQNDRKIQYDFLTENNDKNC